MKSLPQLQIKLMIIKSHFYHIHLYFTSQTRESAIQIQEALTKLAGVHLHHINEKPVGPHPTRQISFRFKSDQLIKVQKWLSQNRQGHSILIHCETGDDLYDHTKGAIWIGKKLVLDFTIFQKES